MKNNTKKVSVSFVKICCIFSILRRFLSLPQISDYHNLSIRLNYKPLLYRFCFLFFFSILFYYVFFFHFILFYFISFHFILFSARQTMYADEYSCSGDFVYGQRELIQNLFFILIPSSKQFKSTPL